MLHQADAAHRKAGHIHAAGRGEALLHRLHNPPPNAVVAQDGIPKPNDQSFHWMTVRLSPDRCLILLKRLFQRLEFFHSDT